MKPRLGGVGWTGVCLVGLFVVLAVFGQALAPYRAQALVAPSLQSPSARHLLGTNQIGQDLLSQLLVGARVSLLIGLLAGTGAVAVGTLVGVVAGWVGGVVDEALLRVIDIMLALPRLPLLILVGAYAGRSTTALAAVIAALFWPGTARVLRALVRSLRGRAHVRAAIGFGSTPTRVVARHVLPELAPVVAASFVAAAGRAVLLQAGLAFLGISDPSHLSWGTIMASAFNSSGIFYTRIWMWWLLPPVAAIVLVLVGITFVEVGVERRFNPRLARHDGVSW